MAIVNSCCFCCSLETGVQIIGWVSVVECLLILITIPIVHVLEPAQPLSNLDKIFTMSVAAWMLIISAGLLFGFYQKHPIFFKVYVAGSLILIGSYIVCLTTHLVNFKQAESTAYLIFHDSFNILCLVYFVLIVYSYITEEE